MKSCRIYRDTDACCQSAVNRPQFFYDFVDDEPRPRSERSPEGDVEYDWGPFWPRPVQSTNAICNLISGPFGTYQDRFYCTFSCQDTRLRAYVEDGPSLFVATRAIPGRIAKNVRTVDNFLLWCQRGEISLSYEADDEWVESGLRKRQAGKCVSESELRHEFSYARPESTAQVQEALRSHQLMRPPVMDHDKSAASQPVLYASIDHVQRHDHLDGNLSEFDIPDNLKWTSLDDDYLDTSSDEDTHKSN